MHAGSGLANPCSAIPTAAYRAYLYGYITVHVVRTRSTAPRNLTDISLTSTTAITYLIPKDNHPDK